MNSKVKFLFVFIILIAQLKMGYNQGSQNPFDLKNRTSRVLISADSPDSIFLKPEPVSLEESPLPSSESNPFNVSHIPLQKETVRKADKKKKKKRKAKTQRSGQQKPSSILDLKFWILLLSCILFALVFATNRNKVSSLYRAILNQNFQKTLARENNNGRNGIFLLMYFLFFLNTALLCYYYIEYNSLFLALNFKIYGYIFCAILATYTFKHLFLSLMGFIFPVHKETSIYSFTITLFNCILGLGIFIINILLILGPETWKYYLLLLAFSALGLFFVVRLLNGTILSSRLASKHTIHFFIYLCSTEIAPIIIFYKLLS